MRTRKLYNRIKNLRVEKGISRKELADHIGVNPQTVGYLERQDYNPSLDLAFRISEFFGFPVEFIFSTALMKPMSLELQQKSSQKVPGITH
ncbi:MAG: helix-turn-helix transcriptional regulator [Candidatus Sabulitectum sp.]|nr:helix-turn-helix transcriptional regulator [Candidatus Sabulitectum sp.]